ncbi:hypothetical protein IC575_003555 [Cucumis melo]
MVRLRSTNTKKIKFTQRLSLGSELHMRKERCCLRSFNLIHGPTSHSIYGNLMIYKLSLTKDRLIFLHDKELRADQLPINFPTSYENAKTRAFSASVDDRLSSLSSRFIVDHVLRRKILSRKDKRN